MAQPPPPPGEEEGQLTSFFPSPPPFFKHFTAENIKLLEEAKAKAADAIDEATSSAIHPAIPQLSTAQLFELPTEVRYLIPPQPPAEDEEYTVFQQATKVRGQDDFDQVVEWIRTQMWNEEMDYGALKGWKYKQLYPSPSESWSSLDRQNYLFRFLRSIMLEYVELLGIMAIDAQSEDKDEKLRNILTLVLNIHALINEYRPHQARETLIRLMEQQVERKKAEVEGIKKMAAKVKDTLDGFEKDAPKPVPEDAEIQIAVHADPDAVSSGMQRNMWASMDEILGH